MKAEEAIKYLKQLYPNGGHCWLDEQRIEAIGMAIAALEHEKPASKDLEEEYHRFLEEEWFNTLAKPTVSEMMFLTAQHFTQWQKEQMMKDAIGLKINRDTLYDLKPIIHEKYLDYKIGDKVKVIIVKDE